MQSVRTAGQKYLTADISPLSATMVRYLFGLPFALVYLIFVSGVDNNDFTISALQLTFALSGLAAAVLQIVATILLIQLFTFRNFAVGGAYARTEVMLTAILGATLFYEYVSLAGWLAILACAVGVVLISLGHASGIERLWNRSAVYGLGAGLSFALTSLLIRQASLSLGLTNPLLAAGITLAYMVTIQTVITVGWVLIREPGQVALVAHKWRPGLFVGVTSVIGSAGWFTAMTLERASYVKTLGQIEFLITLGIAIFYFKEVPNNKEVAGMLLIITAIIVLLIAP